MRTRLLHSSNDSVSSRKSHSHVGHHKGTSDFRHQSTDVKIESHTTVLLQEAIEILEIKPDDTVVDATLGGIGHAQLIVEKLAKSGMFIGFDLDSDAIARAEKLLHSSTPQVLCINDNFRYIDRELSLRAIGHIDKALFDLGWSGFQLGVGRGFSFLRDEPLLMTYRSDGTGLTAREIVNEWEEESIADVIFGWGEEHYSRGIARAIVEYREQKPIETSLQLAEIIRASVPAAYRRGRLHPATKSFQALRIAVNDEMGALTEGLKGAWHKLAPGGRIAVITFHSIEDRFVKQLFVEWEKSGAGVRITHKPTVPTRSEVIANPRSRSAKLRVIQKI